MQLVRARIASTASSSRAGQPWWGRLAMATLPSCLRALGYTFRSGRGPAFWRDAGAVLDAVWTSPVQDADVHRRYLEAPTWVVGYRQGRPIACMGLYDVRELSFALNHLRAEPLLGRDPASYRDLSRLAIVPSVRGGARVVMLGLLHEMVVRCRREGADHILSISVPSLFGVFERFNPSARQVTLQPAILPPPEPYRAYHERIADHVGPVIAYTFDLNGFDALSVILRTPTRPLRRALRGTRGALPRRGRQHDRR